MGKVHNQISRGTTSAAVTKALGVTKGDVGGVERFSETLVPNMDLWSLPDWAYLRTERLEAQGISVNLIAAEFSIVALNNPVGSNVICTLEQASVLSVTASNSSLRILTAAEIVTAGLVASTTTARDTRWVQGATPATSGLMRLLTGTHTATIGSQVDAVFTSTGEFRRFGPGLPIVLSPGFAAAVILETVNITMFVNLGWRVRQALPGELQT